MCVCVCHEVWLVCIGKRKGYERLLKETQASKQINEQAGMQTSKQASNEASHEIEKQPMHHMPRTNVDRCNTKRHIARNGIGGTVPRRPKKVELIFQSAALGGDGYLSAT